MKKLLTLLFGAFAVTSVQAQTLLDVPFTDGAIPTDFTILDEDGASGDVFYADQGLWAGSSSFQAVNFGATLGLAVWACGEFETVPQTADDWLITGAIPLGASTQFTFDYLFVSPGMSIEVLATNSIAGATPSASDFTQAPIATYNTFANQTWVTTPTIDLSDPALANQTVYLAIHHTTLDDATGIAQDKLFGIRNMLVRQTLPIDAIAQSMSLSGAAEIYSTDYLVSDFDYAAYSCGGGMSEAVSITFLNDGTNPITAFEACYIVDSLVDGGTPNCESVTGVNILPGQTYTHTFANTTADFMTAGDDFYLLDGWINAVGDANMVNDSTGIRFVWSHQGHDLAVEGDFTSNYDLIDFTGGQITYETNNWAWTFEDANNDGFSFSITPNPLGGTAVIPTSGDFLLQSVFNSDGVTDADDWAFSPCMTLEAGKSYIVSFQAQCGQDNVGTYPEKLELGVGDIASSGAMSIFQDLGTIGNTSFQGYTACLTVPVTGQYFIGLHAYSDADAWHLDIDDFSVAEAGSGNPVTANFSITNADEENGNTYTEYCDGQVNFVASADPAITDYAWDYDGDGTIDANGPNVSSTGTSFTTNGTYEVMLIITTCNGLDTATRTLIVSDPPALDASFVVIDQGNGNVSIQLSNPFPCGGAQTTVNWGDGTANNLTSHTYTADGDYTITVTLQTATDIAQSTESVTITGLSTAIGELSLEDAMTVVPSPAASDVNVAFSLFNVQDVTMTISTIEGRIVESRIIESAKMVNETFDVRSLDNGIYMINVSTETGSTSSSFVVSH
ncbi:MAG: hypothetical protein CMN34_07420 [Saprospirales bacterium]|nr:hypothetical protein [Saprospirales bacterium]